MARGQLVSLNSGANTLLPTESRGERRSVAILNPNDGVVFVKLNAPAGNTASAWDWKLPSQSYGLFPGPWSSLGLYYADTSGAGLPGELNVYDSDVSLAIPDIRAIGRSVQARSNAMDITEGPQPANPGSGILRVWADAAEVFHILRSTGVDSPLVSTFTALGGVLTGTLPNPGLASPLPSGLSIPNPTLTGTVGGSAPFASGPYSNDWFRNTVSGQGLYNSVNNQGVSFGANGPQDYYTGRVLAKLPIGTADISDAAVTNAKLTNGAAHGLGLTQAAPAGSTTSTTLVALTAPYNAMAISVALASRTVLVCGLLQLNVSVVSNVNIAYGWDGGAQTWMYAQSTPAGNFIVPFSIFMGSLSAATHNLNLWWQTSAGTLSIRTDVYSWCFIEDIRA